MLAELTAVPVYFVLGNHDFYRGSIASTRRVVGFVVSDTPGLVYLSHAGVVELTPPRRWWPRRVGAMGGWAT